MPRQASGQPGAGTGAATEVGTRGLQLGLEVGVDAEQVVKLAAVPVAPQPDEVVVLRDGRREGVWG